VEVIDLKTRLITAVLALMAGLLVLAAQCTNENVRPVALFTVDQVDGPSPLDVNFNASASYDPDGTIESYSWDFGDGTSGTGITTTHTFSSSTDRTFSVELTVTDNGGRTGSTSGFVVVYGLGNGSTLFFDDFQGERDPAWFSTPNWIVQNGKYGCQYSDWKYSYVLTGTNWSDYVVEVDLDSCRGTAGIILRCQEDLQNMVIVAGHHGEIWWKVIVNGDDAVVSDPITPGFFEGEQHVKVVVSGSTYKLYVEDLLRSTFSDTHFAKGMPGLAGRSYYGSWGNIPEFDNFKVTALE